MSLFATKVLEIEGGWALRVRTTCGLKLEYLYPTERQARFFRAVFALDPTRLPPPQKMDLGAGARASRGLERASELLGLTPAEITESVSVLDRARA